jgi:hypothetical protein
VAWGGRGRGWQMADRKWQIADGKWPSGSPYHDPEVPAPRFKLTGPSNPEGTRGVSFV